MKNVIFYVVILCVGMALAWVFLQSSGKGDAIVAASGICDEHSIAEAKCPWCNPSLIEEMGECGGHKVPEALCSRCNADLIPGFKAENDWCGGHNVPESQCTVCLGGSEQCEDEGMCEEHSIAEAKCPWCKPSLIEEMGECGGHKVPEALCSRCNADLIPGFKAENDWCGGHNVPESQCTVCLGGDNCEEDK